METISILTTELLSIIQYDSGLAWGMDESSTGSGEKSGKSDAAATSVVDDPAETQYPLPRETAVAIGWTGRRILL